MTTQPRFAVFQYYDSAGRFLVNIDEIAMIKEGRLGTEITLKGQKNQSILSATPIEVAMNQLTSISYVTNEKGYRAV